MKCGAVFLSVQQQMKKTTEDKQNNGGRIYVAKNRNGPDGIVYPIFMDTANVDIKVLSTYDKEKGTGPSLSQEEQTKFLFDQYKKLMKGAN